MDNVRFFDSKKFMWDGRTYTIEAEALKVKEEYEKTSFETCIVSEEGNYFLFTRRVVTDVVVEGQPPV
jgi:hypothetical protein